MNPPCPTDHIDELYMKIPSDNSIHSVELGVIYFGKSSFNGMNAFYGDRDRDKNVCIK